MATKGGSLQHPMDVALGIRLRLVREKQKISQQTLAEECGITFQQVQKYEKGINRISFSRLTEFADKLGMSVIDIVSPLVSTQAGASAEIGYMTLLKQQHAVALLEAFANLNVVQRKAVLNVVRAMSEDEDSS